MKYILGVSAGFHDASVSVIDNGEILFAGHAERYSKIKNDAHINNELVADALQHGNPELMAYIRKLSPKKRFALTMLSVQENKARQFKDQEKESKKILRMIISEDKEVRKQLSL